MRGEEGGRQEEAMPVEERFPGDSRALRGPRVWIDLHIAIDLEFLLQHAPQ